MTGTRDERRPGRFVVTGSQNLLLSEAVSQGSAGRAGFLQRLPLPADRAQRRVAAGGVQKRCDFSDRMVEKPAHPATPCRGGAASSLKR